MTSEMRDRLLDFEEERERRIDWLSSLSGSALEHTISINLGNEEFWSLATEGPVVHKIEDALTVLIRSTQAVMERDGNSVGRKNYLNHLLARRGPVQAARKALNRERHQTPSDPEIALALRERRFNEKWKQDAREARQLVYQLVLAAHRQGVLTEELQTLMWGSRTLAEMGLQWAEKAQAEA